MNDKTTPDRVLLIDDDQSFGKVLSAMASHKGLNPQYFPSLVDLGSFARIREFDLAIIDYFLDYLRGVEIAEYVDMFFHDIPVVIVSSSSFKDEQMTKWPACVKKFLPKNLGPKEIIESSIEVLHRDRMIKRFARTV